MLDKKLNTYLVCDGDKEVHTVVADDWRVGEYLEFFRGNYVIATFTRVDWWKRANADKETMDEPDDLE